MNAPTKILSSGQAGVGRAALDAALQVGLLVAGWCPKDRWAEDGPIASRYPLLETRAPGTHIQTQRNVEGSSATLVITRGPLLASERLAADLARSVRRPLLVVDLDREDAPSHAILGWIATNQPRVLHVVGARESSAPGIYEETLEILTEVFEAGARGPSFGVSLDHRPCDPRPNPAVCG
ncbi:MAG: putative molybdenum carrier protein [Deltaproteobacteria bacterium]|nr:putative molybdenum carrier protein [Deltaproteobacteria bacterium]